MVSKKRIVLLALPVVIGFSLVYYPWFWVNILMLIDFYTPWVLFESSLYEQYHQFLVDRLPERPELPLLEITKEEANYDNMFKLTDGFTKPIVIRGLLGNTSDTEKWADPEWWLKHYAEEEVLCGTLSNVVEDCTIRTFFSELKNGKPFYISGASIIFDKNPELHSMIDNQQIRDIEPGERTATQIFMGTPKMGSDIHCAIGINIFRQVTGRKRWWFIPPHQTPYLKPSINVNGFSAHTRTLVGKEGATPSPWLNKVERYGAVLYPGDVLVNPPWYWHGIVNLGDDKELVTGAPSRYGKGVTMKAALRSNLVFSINAVLTLIRNYGWKALSPDFKINLQSDIANNRRSREGKELKDAHPFELAD